MKELVSPKLTPETSLWAKTQKRTQEGFTLSSNKCGKICLGLSNEAVSQPKTNSSNSYTNKNYKSRSTRFKMCLNQCEIYIGWAPLIKEVIEPKANIRNYCKSENYKKQVNRVKRDFKPVENFCWAFLLKDIVIPKLTPETIVPAQFTKRRSKGFRLSLNYCVKFWLSSANETVGSPKLTPETIVRPKTPKKSPGCNLSLNKCTKFWWRFSSMMQQLINPN